MKVIKITDNFKELFNTRLMTMLVEINLLRMGKVTKTTTCPTTVTKIWRIMEKNISQCSV